MGTPGRDLSARCTDMKNDIATAEKEIVEIKKSISKFEEAFNAY